MEKQEAKNKGLVSFLTGILITSTISFSGCKSSNIVYIPASKNSNPIIIINNYPEPLTYIPSSDYKK